MPIFVMSGSEEEPDLRKVLSERDEPRSLRMLAERDTLSASLPGQGRVAYEKNKGRSPSPTKKRREKKALKQFERLFIKTDEN